MYTLKMREFCTYTVNSGVQIHQGARADIDITETISEHWTTKQAINKPYCGLTSDWAGMQGLRPLIEQKAVKLICDR